ncbi:MAG TPA: hypothetical protein VME42_06635 [Steroidobacteraceae bacterium]|nr:hypothetical protein [Steroidobacteraceae bacterium]
MQLGREFVRELGHSCVIRRIGHTYSAFLRHLPSISYLISAGRNLAPQEARADTPSPALVRKQ